MNKRSRKALSPVVASIILIAVTVAVSIAVAAWMGALTFSFTATEQVTITDMKFDTTTNTILVVANNTGTATVTINQASVNNAAPVSTLPTFPAPIEANKGLALNITLSDVAAGYSYMVKLMSSKGNAFIYTGTAPT